MSDLDDDTEQALDALPEPLREKHRDFFRMAGLNPDIHAENLERIAICLKWFPRDKLVLLRDRAVEFRGEAAEMGASNLAEIDEAVAAWNDGLEKSADAPRGQTESSGQPSKGNPQ